MVMVMLVCTTALAAIAPAAASAGVPELASSQPNCTSIGNNLAGDCGFELPAATGHLPKMIAAGTGFPDAASGPWFAAANGVDVYPSAAFNSNSGSQSVDLNPAGAGAMYQDIPTLPTHVYQVTFALAGNPCGVPLKTLSVTFDSTSEQLQFDTSSTTASRMGWQSMTLGSGALPASLGGVTRLSFTSTTTGACGPTIDDVAVIDMGVAGTPTAIPPTLSTASPSATPMTTGTSTPILAVTATSTVTPILTQTVTPTSTLTPTQTPPATATSTPLPSSSVPATLTATSEATITPTASQTPTVTLTNNVTPAETPGETPTAMALVAPPSPTGTSSSPTASPSATATSQSPTPNGTPTSTSTSSTSTLPEPSTLSPGTQASPSGAVATATPGLTVTPTATPAQTASVTVTPAPTSTGAGAAVPNTGNAHSVVVPVGPPSSPATQPGGATASLKFIVNNPGTSQADPSSTLYFSLPSGLTLVAVDDPQRWPTTVDEQTVQVRSDTPLAGGESRLLSIEVAGVLPAETPQVTIEVVTSSVMVPDQPFAPGLGVEPVTPPSVSMPPVQLPTEPGRSD